MAKMLNGNKEATEFMKPILDKNEPKEMNKECRQLSLMQIVTALLIIEQFIGSFKI